MALILLATLPCPPGSILSWRRAGKDGADVIVPGHARLLDSQSSSRFARHSDSLAGFSRWCSAGNDPGFWE